MNAYLSRWRGLATQLVAILTLAAIMVFPAQSAFAQAGNPAEAFVQQNVDRGYQILNNSALSGAQRRDQFRDFLLKLTDLHRIGTFTLGQYANSASPADLQAFDKAFTDYAVAVYESRLGKYSGQTLKVTGSVPRATDDVVVNAVVVNPKAASGQQPIRVAFRVRKTTDGRPIITDLEVEGIWLALSERSDFNGFLQQHGGSVSALADNLRAQADQVRAESERNNQFG
jgi:phospholipid transport system substrate-binding protein